MESPSGSIGSASSSLVPFILESPLQRCRRFHHLLGSHSTILYRSAWKCLADSYSLLLQTIQMKSVDELHRLELLRSLKALDHAMAEAERCFRDCVCTSVTHSWLLDKGLRILPSNVVVHLHLHNFMLAYATVRKALRNSLTHQDLHISQIWAAADAKADLSEARKLLSRMNVERKSTDTSTLADFILHKLASTEVNDPIINVAEIPDFLWVDPQCLRTEKYIGRGSYGVVRKVVWLGGCFAAKDIIIDEDEPLTAREVAIHARLCHPNIVNLVGCTKAQNSITMVMELMDKDLKVLMKERMIGGKDPPFTLLEGIDIMLQVARGMEYLHSLNIMHRDLKSSNILVSGQAGHHVMKIADFGMAKAKDRIDSLFTTKPTGTLAWRAPEVFAVPSPHAKYTMSRRLQLCHALL